MRRGGTLSVGRQLKKRQATGHGTRKNPSTNEAGHVGRRVVFTIPLIIVNVYRD
jgi:hypothetical protein